MKHETRLHPEAPRFNRNGYLLDVPENKLFLRRLRATPSLTSIELIRLSKAYRYSAANRSLADHLLANALRIEAISARGDESRARSPFLLELLSEVPKGEGSEADSSHDGSGEGELGTSSDPSNPNEPKHREPPELEFPGAPKYPEICEFKCAWWTVFFLGTGLLMEDCGHGWHVIGACLEG